MSITTSKFSSHVAACIVLLLPGFGASAETVDPEWPCIQALIPQVELAVMWPEPLDDSIKGGWRSDQRISTLARTLGDLEAFTENEENLIDSFADEQPAEKLKDALSQLAEGVVAEANQVRSQYIRGIKRYTRQQISIAAQIEEGLNKLAALDEGNTGEQAPIDRAELEESLHWHERVYDQREQAMVSLCERPVELEEKLSSVLRRLSSHLP